ncbi:MAG: anaerobic sulfatase maturase, partial [Spirochaetes bacterium]|nr:anaerobic sulfatase maturase [Spirochaetota bacterium]MBU0954037.1 anaerobic sulfatase maturase [Spirochaetota bacterium]
MSTIKHHPAPVHSPEPFNIITKPIGPLCNINCEYCFYLDKAGLFPGKNRADFVMSDAVLKSYIRQYIDSQPPGIEEVNFVWQGGEPTLLGLDFFQRALSYQQRYKRAGMTVTNSLQTNATLMDESKAAFFAEHDFLLGVSIDGPERMHDRYRKDRSGKGTFRQVMAGLERIKKHNIRFNTLTVVQENNSKHPLELYSFLKDIGSAFMQFIPIVDTIPGTNMALARSVSAKDWGDFLASIFDEWIKADIGRIFVGHFDMLLGLYAGYPSSMCVHAKTCGRAMAVEHNGDLYSCDHFVRPENYLGNLQTADLCALVDSRKQQDFGQAKIAALPRECRTC